MALLFYLGDVEDIWYVSLLVLFIAVHARPIGALVFKALTFSIADGLMQSMPLSFLKKYKIDHTYKRAYKKYVQFKEEE